MFTSEYRYRKSQKFEDIVFCNSINISKWFFLSKFSLLKNDFFHENSLKFILIMLYYIVDYIVYNQPSNAYLVSYFLIAIFFFTFLIIFSYASHARLDRHMHMLYERYIFQLIYIIFVHICVCFVVSFLIFFHFTAVHLFIGNYRHY